MINQKFVLWFLQNQSLQIISFVILMEIYAIPQVINITRMGVMQMNIVKKEKGKNKNMLISLVRSD
jgi:hypothetical protein